MRFTKYFLMTLGFLLANVSSFAQTETDWGVIPIGQETTISFSAYDITRNFTDQYAFSLKGAGDASYAVKVSFDACAQGCGNPDLGYGVYNANGSLISDGGTVVLEAGDYVFQVKGTGFGSGNAVSYTGSMNFFVSSVPEPGDVVLMFAGLTFLIGAIRRKNAVAGTASKVGPIAMSQEPAACAH